MMRLSIIFPLLLQAWRFGWHTLGVGRPEWTFLGDDAGWSIDHDGENTLRIMQKYDAKVNYASLPFCIKTQILHFGSLHAFKPRREWRYRWIRADRIVVTCFHGNFGNSKAMDRSLSKLLSNSVEIDRLIVSNETMYKRFIKWGFPRDRLRKISVGVDTRSFIPVTEETRASSRHLLNIPEGHIVVGSFQKDGKGWLEGLDPKYEKGPDIFCNIITALAKEFSLHVLLTGPSRGYVKSKLESAGVSYTHRFLDSPDELPPYYHACDFYLMCSREEGGPKSVPESLACGIPLIATRTGLARDVESKLKIGWFADIDDEENLIALARNVILDKARRKLYRDNAILLAETYSFNRVGKAHLTIYKELIK